MDAKKVPARKCIGCGQMKDKSSLLRLVKNASGVIVLDISGKAQCRGAYICKDRSCIALAAKQHRIERAFSVKKCDEAYAALNETVF